MTVVLSAERPTRGSRALAALSVAAPVGAVAVSVVRAVHRGWYPVQDNAYFSLRARDVLTEHHPLLGTWTSASLSLDQAVNNPGPLLFDVFALPAKINATAGLAVGAALLNIGCIVAMAIVANRRGGAPRVVLTMAAAAALAWTMGSELLFDPWQPHVLIFPFLLLMVMVWNLVVGDIGVLPGVVLVASLLVGSHLGYGVVVGGLGLGGVAACLSVRRREGWDGARRPLVVSLVVAALCWTQPAIEQVTAVDGNLGRVLASSTTDQPRAGVALAARFVAGTSVVPPAWSRPSFESSLLSPWLRDRAEGGNAELVGTPSSREALVGLILLAVVVGGVGWMARRRADRLGQSGVATVIAALVLSSFAVATLPLGIIGSVGVLPHQVRFLWPVGILVPAVTAFVLAGHRRSFVPLATAVALTFAIATVPTHRQPVGPSESADAMSVMLEISSQLRDLSVDGPVLVSDADLAGLRPFEPYTTPVMLELTRVGVELVVDGDVQARQLGEDRRHPELATSRLIIRLGSMAEVAPAGSRRIAGVRGLTSAEAAELDELRAGLPAQLAGELRLNDRGRQAARLGLLAGIEEDGSVDPGAALAGGSLLSLAGRDLLDPGDPLRYRLHRYSELRRQLDRLSLGVYLVPISRTTTP